MSENRLVAVDGNSLINRAYYAMKKPMITKEGVFTQGIFGFLNMLNRVLREYDPAYCAVAWDRKAPTFRAKQYTEYKAGRKKMPPELAMELPIMKEILTALGIRNLELDGFEADDIIGTITRMSEEENVPALIVTGDKDSLQLVSEETHVLLTKKGVSEFDLYDPAKMAERYGGLDARGFLELKGVMGDSSDHLPGVPGVGEKTGIKLIQEFGTVENLLAHTDEIQAKGVRTKVEENGQLAAMTRRLSEIFREVPIEESMDDLRRKDVDYGSLVSLYSKLEFNSFLRKLKTEGKLTAEAADPVPEAEHLPESEAPADTVILSSQAELSRLEQIPDGSDVWLYVMGNEDHIAVPVVQAAAVRWKDTFFFLCADACSTVGLSAFCRFLNQKKFRFHGHDLGSSYFMLMHFGLENPETAFDSKIAQYVLDPSRSDYSMKVLSLDILKRDFSDEKEIRESAAQTDLFNGAENLIRDFSLEYLMRSCELETLQIPELEKEELTNVFEKAELPLIAVLAAMEKEGVTADASTLGEIGVRLDEEIASVERAVYDRAGEEFNILSPKQLGTILFEKMGLPPGKKTKTGYSTSADVLEKIRGLDPIVDDVLQYRALTKLKGTYVDGLRPLIGADGKIHAHFQQTVTATGRLSCTEPNLQNIPVRTEMGREIRKAFVASPGRVLIGADYSQIELRILAHLSGDENLIHAFNEGQDIHRTTASRVFNIPYEDVTPIERSRAKAVNFGVIYGMSGFGLSDQIHVSRREAEKYISDYFEKHPKVKAFMDRSVEDCRERGYSLTLMGRKRWIHEIHSSNRNVRQLGERLAMNSPIQGTAADIIKLAMIRVDRELRSRALKSRLILQIHDELIIDTYEEEREEVSDLLRRNMEGVMELRVALLCDMNEAYSWYELKG